MAKVNKEKVVAAARNTDRWLRRAQEAHVRMVEKSIRKLQDSIIDNATMLVLRGGKLEGLRTNLKQAQKLHRKIEELFEEEWSPATQELVDSFQEVLKVIGESFGELDRSVRFTNLDRDVMDVLKTGTYQDFAMLGSRYRDQVTQAVYDHVIGQQPFSALVSSIEQALMGSKATGVTGRPLVQYARLYARDSVMNFQRQVNLKKSEDAGFDTFLYVGAIISTTRPFCRRRVNKIYTKPQIEAWTYSWAGKSGPAMTNCGGYNCNHHWQPVKREWLDEEDQKKIQTDVIK